MMMYSTGNDIHKVVVQPKPSNASSDTDESMWKAKYEKSQEQFEMLRKRNEELEERLLNLVEKVEGEKLMLSEEIDLLAGQLASANNKVVTLERECARYKKDCILAVHLLQCQPSHYVQSKDAPKGLFSDEKGTEQNSDTIHVSSSMMTFPPMPVYMEEAEQDSETQPEDPTPLTAADSSISGRSETETLTALKTSASFTSEFVHKIDADEDYSCVELRRCKNCDEIVTAMSRSTQTATPQPPRPKMVDDFPRIHFSLDERIGEQIV